MGRSRREPLLLQDGIYPFHDGPAKPRHYRVNLGCIDELDPLGLAIDVIDGRSY